MSAPNGNKVITYDVEARKKAGVTGKSELVRERKSKASSKG